MHLFIKDGTPTWTRTYSDVSTTVGLYYFFEIKDGDAKNKEYNMYYSTTLTTVGGCAAPNDCASWLEYHPAN